MPEHLLFRLGAVPENLLALEALLKEARGLASYAFLESSRTGAEDQRNLFFKEPVGFLVLRAQEDPASFFSSLEAALARGFWAVGFLAYELGYLLERKLRPLLPPVKGPLAYFLLFKAPEILPAGLVKAYQPPELFLTRLRLNMAQADYLKALEKIKDYIACGDTYQVNFTLKYHFDLASSPEEVYLSLRPKQRVRYGGLLKTGDFAVVSLSPELFLRRQRNLIWTKPMKGTAPRGLTLAEDQKIAHWLAHDPKNQAENVMIVDLLRNDLGRVCVPGSVYVPSLFEVEKYETVFQMISTVKGELAGNGLFSLFKALFPCGSVTGAPKVRTMEIIAELEREPRGVYTGAFGYFSPEGDFVLNVAIRTLFLQGGQGEFGLGSGVVWDSDPVKEYEECLLKARFLREPPLFFHLVETMRFDPEGGIRLLAYHLRRLKEAAAYFDFPLVEEKALNLLKRAGEALTRPAKLRLLLAPDGGLTLEAYTLSSLPRPLKIGLARRNFGLSPFLFYKTTHRPWYESWRARIKGEGLFEVVFFDEEERLLEGTITNVFLRLNGRLYTPPATLGLLPGVLRQSLLEKGLVEEKVLTLADLARAEAVFLGNAVRGLVRVDQWHFLKGPEKPVL